MMRTFAKGLRFPEGVIANSDGSVLSVELHVGTIAKADGGGGFEVIARPGHGPNGLAYGPDGMLYCCNNGGYLWHEGKGTRQGETPQDYTIGRIERIDPQTGLVTRVYERSAERVLSGPNDIVFDKQGGFYFTDMGKTTPNHRVHGAVYYALPDGSKIVEIAFPMVTPNGIGLSPDEKTLYVAETNTARLWAFDLDEPGVIRPAGGPAPHGGRIVCGVGGYQRFDSLAVEACGNICVATMITGLITVISPDGEVVETVETGDPHTTNICFGGPDLTTAYITLSGKGEIGEMAWPRPGLKLNFSL